MWTELQASIECLTQLLLLTDIMSSSVISDSDLDEAARLLQQQLIYNGDVLGIALESIHSFKECTQSLTYLSAGSVHLAYALLRMLERWGKQNSRAIYVRKKKISRRKRGKGNSRSDFCTRPHDNIGDMNFKQTQRPRTVFLTSKMRQQMTARRKWYTRQCSPSKLLRRYGPRSIRTTLLIMITSPSVRNSHIPRSLGRCLPISRVTRSSISQSS